MEWQPVLNLVVTAIIIPTIILIGVVIRGYAKKLGDKLDIEAFDNYLLILEDMVAEITFAVERAYIEGMQEEDAWTKERQREIFEEIKRKVMEQVTEKGQELLEQGMGDYQSFIESLIENQMSDFELIREMQS